MGARDDRRREDNSPLKDLAVLRMRSITRSLSLDMMIVRREVALRLYRFALPTANCHCSVFHFFFFFESRDYRATSKLSTKTHRRVSRPACLVNGLL